ncbi:MAG TPA: hypothetical protein VJT73_18245 [Polyangiaceae bacterium]|nr:hypothetical protein [Polyangiaceae bacterium]
MMNSAISLADWHRLPQLDSGMYGYMPSDPSQPENPILTMAVPRIVTLSPGQVIFRWCHSGAPVPAASPWWSTKRGAQAILRAALGGDSSDAARSANNVAKMWKSDLRAVVFAKVLAEPVRCFLGVGRAIWDARHRERLDSKQHQLYIPNMTLPGTRTLSPEALSHFSFRPAIPSAQVTAQDWEAATGREF